MTRPGHGPDGAHSTLPSHGPRPSLAPPSTLPSADGAELCVPKPRGVPDTAREPSRSEDRPLGGPGPAHGFTTSPQPAEWHLLGAPRSPEDRPWEQPAFAGAEIRKTEFCPNLLSAPFLGFFRHFQMLQWGTEARPETLPAHIPRNTLIHVFQSLGALGKPLSLSLRPLGGKTTVAMGVLCLVYAVC